VKTINFKTLYKFEGYVVTEFKCEETCVQIKLAFDGRIPPKCPNCSAKLPKNKAAKSCALDSPVATANTTFILFPNIQGKCPKCEHYVTTRPKEIHPTKSVTWRYMRLISSWARIAPINQIAQQFSLSASSVRNYHKEVLKTDTPPPQLDNIRALLVDEKSVRKNHHYVTLVLNADTGELLHMDEGKKQSSLDSFLTTLTDEQKSTIQAVGMDRGGAYQRSVKENLPNADIVYDHFHLKMNINSAVDEVRRSEWNKADKSEKKYIKSSRYLLLANEENLDQKGVTALAALRAANTNISTAYILKEQFSIVYAYKRVGWARRYLKKWCDLARNSGLKSFERLAKSFTKSSEEIVSYVKHKITSGRIEGFNNLLSRIVHRSCGVQDLDYLYTQLRYESVMRIV
jgi:transposase